MADGLDEVNRAIEGFLAELADDRSLGKLRAYAAGHGYNRLDGSTNLVVRDTRTGWNVSARTADKNMSTLKSSFDYAVTEGLIEFGDPSIRCPPRAKGPFSDAEIERMYGVSNRVWAGPTDWSRPRGLHCGFFLTGLRISNVATFQIDRGNGEGGVLVGTTRGGKRVYTEVPDWLLARIRDRVIKHGSWIFGTPNTASIDVITDLKAAGIAVFGPGTPIRIRSEHSG